MDADYSVETCKKLTEKFHLAALHRPMRISRYDPGTELIYNITPVVGDDTCRTRLVVEKFVGGGFAGQVYRVKLTDIETKNGPIDSLKPGGVYAMKILIPPSNFSRLFRNLLYWVGFQGPFQLQVNPSATKSAALWQKFIRRGAKIRFGDETAVADIYATFVDETIGGCGQLSEWVEGRTWRLEVDNHMDLLKRWRRNRTLQHAHLGSIEYRAKKVFMEKLVELLHNMGAHEFARQYEWSTCKSQPNCLKRSDTENNPPAGLVAIDFGPGLTLLPFLPMSPGDFKLIVKGLMRGSLVQFDRGDVAKLESFINTHSNDFADLQPMLEELKTSEAIYRNSIPDITHNHIRILYSRQLFSTMLASAVTGWKIRGLVDDNWRQKLRYNKVLTVLFSLIGLIPLLGRFVRMLWARPDWRKHYIKMLTNWDYFLRAIRAGIAEKIIVWHRSGRVSPERAVILAEQPWRFFGHLPLSILPARLAGLHRFLTDWAFFKDKLHYLFIRPIKLYFSAKLREQWLRDMVRNGKKKHILTDQDAETILSQLDEPYIQRYLVSLVVHLLTLPLTQIVSVIVAWIYYRKTGDELGAGGILVLFQVIPISPGSIARGLYAVAIMIYDRSFKNYNIAVFLSFFKYIGYLAFPIQMTYHYPVLARFMAAHWATEAVHIVPVFGERGALLEHWVFGLFYNWPLTIRRRMQSRARMRASIKPRYWHVGTCAVAAAAIFGIADFTYLENVGRLPALKDIWPLTILIPLICGSIVTLAAGGASLPKRIIASAVCASLVSLLYTTASAILGYPSGITPAALMITLLWRAFVFTILSTVGTILTELKLPEPAQF